MLTPQTKAKLLQRVRRAMGAPEPALQAALLPWRKSSRGIEIMLVTSRGTGRWILPKGWPEHGESLRESAMREALEEAGVEGNAADTALGSYFYDKVLASGLRRRCEVRVFAMQVKDQRKNWPERGERERKWFSPQEAAALVMEPDLAELIADFRGKHRKTAA
ncbi:MAG: NUDIX hydrolase [Notoacmeibacter sp.]|nr:NUDIX hydrolase [Notoacmeibacter sp.]MCC0032931.1 NUDIX hydrolase [Brucellaceae bacterium]